MAPCRRIRLNRQQTAFIDWIVFYNQGNAIIRIISKDRNEQKMNPDHSKNAGPDRRGFIKRVGGGLAAGFLAASTSGQSPISSDPISHAGAQRPQPTRKRSLALLRIAGLSATSSKPAA
jgi:hypothetical protein